NIAPDKGIGVKFYLGKKYIHDLIIDLKIKGHPLVFGNFKRPVIGIDASQGILHQPAQLPYLKIALEITGNDIGGINIDNTGTVVLKSGRYLKVLKIIGIVLVLIIGLAEIEIPYQIVQGIARYIHVDIPLKY